MISSPIEPGRSFFKRIWLISAATPLSSTTTVAILMCLLLQAPAVFAQKTQKIEGFDTVLFHYNGNRTLATNDYRGSQTGYMTAAWWAPEQMKHNVLKWRTAVIPQKETTTIYFVGASAPTPAEFSRGPEVKLTVNGHYALTFNIGILRDYT